MKKKELIKQLSKMPKGAHVFLSIDPEGNAFRKVEDVSLMSYDGNDFGIIELTDEMRKQGYSEEDYRGDGRAVVLWP